MFKKRVSNKASWKHFCSSGKSRFGAELTEAEIDVLVEELLILEFLLKQLFYPGLLEIKLY